MKNSDKTQTYSDNNKTSIYGSVEKRTKETVHELKPGDQINLNSTEYQIIEIISESTGEAVIYKVNDAEGKTFGLKLYYEFYHPEQEPNTEALERIETIDDKDILKLFDFGTGTNKYKAKYCFEILDFADGGDLLNIVNIREKYNPDFLEKEVIPQIFKGILRLHNNKIYHCDLKPQNVFYLDKEQVEIVIGDYGSAKTFDFDTEKKSRKTTTVKGTDFYLPPEQARGFISEKNDYYSFGMILLHLLYPEKILNDENKANSLSHAKLKQIIERQFEAQPIIDYNPGLQRINTLIEGLTLVDFKLRWGKNEVLQWMIGEDVAVQYKLEKPADKSKTNVLKFGNYTINNSYDLREYILNDSNWYDDLIENETNRKEFTDWLLNQYEGDRSRRSAFNRIVKLYSQEGIDFVADAIIRFFIPEHPIMLGLQQFNFADTEDISIPTAKAFSHLIFDLWDNCTDKDISQFIFSYEFALRQTQNQAQAQKALEILYEKLLIDEKLENNFADYNVHAFTKVGKKSLQNIQEFLIELLPSDIEIEPLKLDNKNHLHYNVIQSINTYLQEKGISNQLSINSLTDQSIQLIYPVSSDSFEDFIDKTTSRFKEDFLTQHNITGKISAASEKKLKQRIEIVFEGIINDIEKELEYMQENFSSELKKIEGFSTDLKALSKVLKDIKFEKVKQVLVEILNLKTELERVKETKELLVNCQEIVKKDSMANDLLKEAKDYFKTKDYKEIEKAWHILTSKHTFKFETLFEVKNIQEHKEIHYEELENYKRLQGDTFLGTLAFSPDGRYIAAAGNLDDVLLLFSPNVNNVVFNTKIDFNPENISISKDGKYIACTGMHDKNTLVFDSHTGKQIHSLKKKGNYAKSPTFSPDNKHLAVAGYGDAILWDFKQGKIIKEINGSNPVCFHPFKNILATRDHNDQILIVNVETNETEIVTDEHPGTIEEIRFHPNGKIIASACHDDEVRIWNIETRELLHSIAGHPQYQKKYICFSPDGKLLASLLNSGAICLWNVKTGMPLLSITGFEHTNGLDFHPNGEYLALADQYYIYLLNLKHSTAHQHEMSILNFVSFENEQVENLGKLSNRDSDNQQVAEAEREYWKGFNEEYKQREKWVSREYKKAIEHYKKAAELGHELAKQKLIDLKA